jgi:hypothetical protein
MLASCASAPPPPCPPWPVAGPAVASELVRLPEAQYPATWGWIARLDVLRDQLEICRGEAP